MNDDKRKQVADQCMAVSHQAALLAAVFADFAKLMREGPNMPAITEMKGQQSAALMKYLEACLVDMDAITEDDAWLVPVFEKARTMFPQQRDTDRADAHLISAAPDLLAALETALTVWSWVEKDGVFKQAWAAVAKAKGIDPKSMHENRKLRHETDHEQPGA